MARREAKELERKKYSEEELLMIKFALFTKINKWLNNNSAAKRMSEKMGKVDHKLSEFNQKVAGR